jgi:hypothetical protein
MLRLVAFLIVSLLGRLAAEGGYAHVATGTDAWRPGVSVSPAPPSPGATHGRATVTSLVPIGVVPSGVAPNDRVPTSPIGALLHERSRYALALPSRLQQSARDAALSGRERLIFPYDATAPPRRR